MLDNIQVNTKDNIKKRVLFTGNGTLVINDLIRLLPMEYESKNCFADENDFFSTLNSFNPHTIVVCLLKESKPMLNLYKKLETITTYVELPIIVIGNEEDCTLFKYICFMKNLTIMPRPINTDDFLEILSSYTDLSLQNNISKNAINPILQDITDDSSLDHKMEKIAEMQVQTAAVFSRKTSSHSIDFNKIQGRKTILVIDDDVRILNIIKLYLQDLYNVIPVPNGKLALKYLSKNTADLVLLDYMMPDEDGPAVLKQIRQDSPHPNIPVLFLTGVDDKDLVMKGLQYNPEGYCLKPVTQDTLIERVTAILLGL